MGILRKIFGIGRETGVCLVVQGQYGNDIELGKSRIKAALSEFQDEHPHIKAGSDEINVQLWREGDFLVSIEIVCSPRVAMELNQDLISTFKKHSL